MVVECLCLCVFVCARLTMLVFKYACVCLFPPLGVWVCAIWQLRVPYLPARVLYTLVLYTLNKFALWDEMYYAGAPKASSVHSFGAVNTKTQSKHKYIPKSGSFSCFTEQTNSCFLVIYLALCFSVGTWEDTTKHLASFTSFRMSIYWNFGWIVGVHMVLFCFQLAVMSAMSSCSKDCIGCHNNAAEHHIWL